MIYVLLIILILFPVLITLCEFHALFAECLKTHKKGKFTKAKDFFHHYAWSIELVLYGICFWFEYLLLDFMDVKWSEKWTEQLYNLEMHQPINPDYAFGYTSIILFFFASIVVLYMTKADRTPPLITGLSIAGLYIGSAYSIIWTVHISGLSFKLLLFFLPINTVLISLRLLVRKIHEYQPSKERMSKIEGNRFLSALNSFRQKAIYFPVLGFILVIPLLGAIVLILIIFGQAPDSAIKAFTETSDFLLSQKVSPQNLTMDMHYLCTVAAGGDRKIVKPLRRGIRHGHEVIVNRQLEVANAFEEVLMIRAPKFHKKVRHFYDTYGFPIAKLIKRNFVADMVYLIMKPLEWCFVLVLYLTEVHPEDRIALQYTGTTLERFQK